MVLNYWKKKVGAYANLYKYMYDMRVIYTKGKKIYSLKRHFNYHEKLQYKQISQIVHTNMIDIQIFIDDGSLYE